jgi:hypothetical protein
MGTAPLIDLIVELANNVACIEEAMAVFDAIADRADEANIAGHGIGLRCIQSVATDSMIVSCGRLVDTTRRTVSFNELCRVLKATPIKDPKPLVAWLTTWQCKAPIPSATEAVKSEFITACQKLLTESSRKVIELRHKFVAHREANAKWEAIGATFPDVERTIKLAYDAIDASSAAFLDLPSVSENSRSATTRKITAIRDVIDRALRADRASP